MMVIHWQVTVASDDPGLEFDPYGLFAATTIGKKVKWHHEVPPSMPPDELVPDFRTEEY